MKVLNKSSTFPRGISPRGENSKKVTRAVELRDTRKVLDRTFFEHQNTIRVAKNLLGKVLLRRHRGKTRAYVITEVEAYDGPHDKASHTYRGKTARNTPMFGAAGRWYVYFVYGAHWMLNIVTGPKNYPAALLIRGATWIDRLMLSSQGTEKTTPRSSFLTGPGKITRALKIDKKFNGKRANKKTGLWIEDWGIKVPPRAIKKVPRVGVAYAEEWAQKPYRFMIDPKRPVLCCTNRPFTLGLLQ